MGFPLRHMLGQKPIVKKYGGGNWVGQTWAMNGPQVGHGISVIRPVTLGLFLILAQSSGQLTIGPNTNKVPM